MLLVMDEAELFDRHKVSNHQIRVQAIEELRTSLRRNGPKVVLDRVDSFVRILSQTLTDKTWSVRHQAVQLVNEVLPHLGNDLDAVMRPIVPDLVANALDNKMALRKAANQALQAYAIKQSTSSDSGTARACIVRAFFRATSPCVIQTVANLLPTRAEALKENVFSLVEVLTSEEAVGGNGEAAAACLDRLREATGDEKFGSFLARLSDAHRRCYQDLNRGFARSTVAAETIANGSPLVDARRSRHVSDPPVAEKTETSFGFISADTMTRLRDAKNWRVRVQAISELAATIEEMTDVRTLMPHLSSFIDFLGVLLDDANFKVTLTTLDIVERLVGKVSLGLKPSLDKLVTGLSKKLGDNKIIRQANMKVFTRLMQAMTPKPILDALAPALKHRNSKVREEALNIIIAALLTYPSYEFDLPAVVESTALSLIDNKQRVRQAGLELFSVLASTLGSGNLTPLVAAVARAERTFDTREEGQEAGVMAAVQARLARRQLPRISADGLVEHSNPVPISSATSVASHRPSVSGPDIDWILAAPGNAPSSVSSASSAARSDYSGTVVSTPAKLPSMNPMASVPTPRRYCSAGKRLPWMKEGRQTGSATLERGKEKASSAHPGGGGGAQLPSRPPLKAKTSWGESKNHMEPSLSPPHNSPLLSADGSRVSLAQAVNPAAQLGSYAEKHLTKLMKKSSGGSLSDSSATTSASSMRSGPGLSAGGGEVSSPRSRKTGRVAAANRKNHLLKPLSTMPGRMGLFPSFNKQDAQELLMMSNDSLSQSWPRQRPVLLSGHGRKERVEGAEAEAESEMEKRRQQAVVQLHGTPLPRKATMARPGSKTKPTGSNVGQQANSMAVHVDEKAKEKEKLLVSLNQRAGRSQSDSPTLLSTDKQQSNHNGKNSSNTETAMPIQRKPSIPKPRVRKPSRSKSLEEQQPAFGQSDQHFRNGGEGVLSGLIKKGKAEALASIKQEEARKEDPPRNAATLAESTKRRAETLRASSLRSMLEEKEETKKPLNLKTDKPAVGKTFGGENAADGVAMSQSPPMLHSPEDTVNASSTAATPAAVSPENLTSSLDSGQGSFSSKLENSSGHSSPSSDGNGSGSLPTSPPNQLPSQKKPSLTDLMKRVPSGGALTGISSHLEDDCPPLKPSFSPSLKNRLSKAAPADPTKSSGVPRKASGSRLVDASQQLTVEGSRYQPVPLTQSKTEVERVQQHQAEKARASPTTPKRDQHSLRSSPADPEVVEEPVPATQPPKLSASLAKRLVKSKESEARQTVRRRRTSLEDSLQLSVAPSGRPSVSSPLTSLLEKRAALDRESVLSVDKPVDEVLEPCANPNSALRDALRYIGATSEDWDVKCEGLSLVRRLILHHPSVLSAQLQAVKVAVVAEIKNLRSSVARLAIQCIGELFVSLGRLMDSELDLSVRTLLSKGSESSGFIRQDVERALSQMVNGVTPLAAVKALLATGFSHRSAAVRKMTAQFLYDVVEKVGADRLMGGSSREMVERVVPAAVQFTMDGSPQARYFGRAILHCLLVVPEFDRLVPRMLAEKMQRQLQTVVDGLRNKGLGELPSEKMSAKRKTSSMSQSSRASSVAPDLLPRQSPLRSERSEGSSAGGKSREGTQRGRPPRPRPAGRDQQGALPSAVLKKMSSSNWRDRYDGITELLQLSVSSPGIVGGNIVKMFDYFAPRLTDSNSKVNVYALESFEAMVPHLAAFMEPIVSLLVPALSSNLASKNATISTSARNIIDSIIQRVDNAVLIQSFASVVQFGNSKAMPFMTEKLALLVDSVYPRQPKLVHRHILPIIWHFVSSHSGKVVAMTGEARLAASTLIHIMYANMGQSLIDQARHLPPRDQQTLTSLLESFGPG
eukprot:m.15805 g.15805  ORF g.15805 m.15805 type:complete len:1854 (+) comp26567_c0_seq2:408-5969(+)